MSPTDALLVESGVANEAIAGSTDATCSLVVDAPSCGAVCLSGDLSLRWLKVGRSVDAKVL